MTSLLLDEPSPRAAAPSAAGSERRRVRRVAAALLLPSLVFLAGFTYWPALRVIGDSLLVGRFAGEHAVGFDNYARIAGHWSRFTGYFAPRKAAYDLPEMKQYLADHPDAKVALDQLQYAMPWFDTYNTIAVRKAMEDQVQAVLSGKTTPAAAVAAAQKNAGELLRPYVEQTALKLLA